MADLITITIPLGGAVRIDLADLDHQFIIAYESDIWRPKGAMKRAIRVMANTHDTSGRHDVIFEEFAINPMTGVMAELPAETHEEIKAAAAEAGLTLKLEGGLELPMKEVPADKPIVYDPKTKLPVWGGESVSEFDKMIAASIARDEDGTVPTEPLESGIANASATGPAATPEQAQNPSTGAQTQSPTAPVSSAAPRLRDITKAPRDGKTIMLVGTDGEESPARWSSAFGRQFWVDEYGETLGFDDSFQGWRELTDTERADLPQ